MQPHTANLTPHPAPVVPLESLAPRGREGLSGLVSDCELLPDY